MCIFEIKKIVSSAYNFVCLLILIAIQWNTIHVHVFDWNSEQKYYVGYTNIFVQFRRWWWWWWYEKLSYKRASPRLSHFKWWSNGSERDGLCCYSLARIYKHTQTCEQKKKPTKTMKLKSIKLIAVRACFYYICSLLDCKSSS
jgi:hypothetical protein